MRVSMVATAVVMVLAGAQAARAQGWQPPADSQRCPSKWGPQDQRGSGNHMKPDTVLRPLVDQDRGAVGSAGAHRDNALPAGRRSKC